MLKFERSSALNNIPQRKILEYISDIENSELDLKLKSIKITAIMRYSDSNIPIQYWKLNMEKDFRGDQRLLNEYNKYVLDLKSSYSNGYSLVLAGRNGTGKTLTLSCILKRASEKGYSCLYTTMSDIVSILTQAHQEEKYIARKELTMVDYLVIDELDNRFFQNSELSNELFAKTFETIIRTRLQSKLPILMATNSPNIKESFAALFKDSLNSIMFKIPIFIVMGEDFRKIPTTEGK